MDITLILIVLSTQTLHAYSGETLAFEAKVSTGSKTRSTPTGWYRVTGKDPDHVSNLYPETTHGGAPMSWALLLERGLAIHQGVVTKPYASHGCCRVGRVQARFLYRHTRVGTWVVIVQEIH